MFETDYVPFLEATLFETFGQEIEVDSFQFMGGGCINNSLKINTIKGDFFLKWNESPDALQMFETEAKGLQLLTDTQSIRIPKLLGYGRNEAKAYLLLEFITPYFRNDHYWKKLGESLATLHQHTYSKFGLHFNNFIGSLPQSNEFFDDWVEFFIDRRLRVQAGLAYYNGLVNKDFLSKMEKLYLKLPHLLPKEKPALLHGDLWSGNVIQDEKGEPCLIDPAVYYGNREIEIAFTSLFGGFDDEFYQVYHSNFPLEKGFEQRIGIYHLYPLLIHVNLFGTSYLSGVERILNRFIGINTSLIFIIY
jgi:protein-ribulosamine 3-kinase